MPDEQPISINLNFSEARQVAERVWELPPWHTWWGRAVYPLMIASKEGYLFPLGTAFRFSKFNHIFTARHSIEGGLQQHHPNKDRFIRDGLEAARRSGTIDHTQFAIVSQGPNPKRGDISFDVRGFDSIHAAPPTDLVIGNFLNDDSTLIPALVPTITFAPPRVGEIVRCVGYCDSEVPENGLSVDEIRSGRLDPYKEFSHRLLAIEGRVKNIFINGLSSSFIQGPCFTIDAEVPNGLSGGPIFNSNGAVCGAVYSGASMFFDEPTTVGALFYPIFLLRLSFGTSMAGGRFTLRATERPMAELVATQAIRTDGAEEDQLHFTPEDGGARVGAAFHKDDAAFIFEDFQAFQAGKPMAPLEGQKLRRLKPNLDHPLVKKRRGLGGENS
jgi:hypothetical protein